MTASFSNCDHDYDDDDDDVQPVRNNGCRITLQQVTNITTNVSHDDDAGSSSVDNNDDDDDDDVEDHQHGLDLNNRSTTMETDLDEQHDVITESKQRHYSSSFASNLDDSMRANNPSECSRSVSINTMENDSATTKSTVTNYRSDSSIGAPYSSTGTGISGCSLRPNALTVATSCVTTNGTTDVTCNNHQQNQLKLDQEQQQQLSSDTSSKQSFKSFSLLRNIVKRASFRRASTSSTAMDFNTQQQQQQQTHNLPKSSLSVTSSSIDCSRSMASLLLPSPEEKLVQLSDQFKPKFVPIDVDTMFKRCNSSRRSLLHVSLSSSITNITNNILITPVVEHCH